MTTAFDVRSFLQHSLKVVISGTLFPPQYKSVLTLLVTRAQATAVHVLDLMVKFSHIVTGLWMKGGRSTRLICKVLAAVGGMAAIRCAACVRMRTPFVFDILPGSRRARVLIRL